MGIVEQKRDPAFTELTARRNKNTLYEKTVVLRRQSDREGDPVKRTTEGLS